MSQYRIIGRPMDASYYTIQDAQVGDVVDLDPDATDTQALLDNGAIEEEGASDAGPAATAGSDPADTTGQPVAEPHGPVPYGQPGPDTGNPGA